MLCTSIGQVMLRFQLHAGCVGYSPFALIGAVLNKLQVEEVDAILILPKHIKFWQNQDSINLLDLRFVQHCTNQCKWWDMAVSYGILP